VVESVEYLEAVGKVQMCTTTLTLCNPWETRLKLLFRLPDNSDYAQTKQLKWCSEYQVVIWVD